VPWVLLHDSLGCVELWRDFPVALARATQRPVVAYDRLGFGRSSARNTRPSLRFIAEEAESTFPALRAGLRLDEFALFGHSVGGAMALCIAAALPQVCRVVVSESAQAFVEKRTLAGIAEAQARFAQPAQFERLVRWHGDKAAWVLDAWTGVWQSPDYAEWQLQPCVASVRCPVLVLHGDNDEFGSLAFPRAIAAAVAGPVELELMEGCGHVPHREHPAHVLDVVQRFLHGVVTARLPT
jgi:pimeloyl-ACP methyl ester carboxylesterase